MLRMTANELSHYAAKGYNRVAITRRVLADLDTPLSAYLKLAAKPFSYLLESVEGGEDGSRRPECNHRLADQVTLQTGSPEEGRSPGLLSPHDRRVELVTESTAITHVR